MPTVSFSAAAQRVARNLQQAGFTNITMLTEPGVVFKGKGQSRKPVETDKREVIELISTTEEITLRMKAIATSNSEYHAILVRVRSDKPGD